MLAGTGSGWLIGWEAARVKASHLYLNIFISSEKLTNLKYWVFGSIFFIFLNLVFITLSSNIIPVFIGEESKW